MRRALVLVVVVVGAVVVVGWYASRPARPPLQPGDYAVTLTREPGACDNPDPVKAGGRTWVVDPHAGGWGSLYARVWPWSGTLTVRSNSTAAFVGTDGEHLAFKVDTGGDKSRSCLTIDGK